MADQRKLDLSFLTMAFAASKLSTCPRGSVGAVVALNNKMVATGYNGAPRRIKHCFDVGCSTDDGGRCTRAVHAEVNAILQCRGVDINGGTVYCTHRPCLRCTSIIINSGLLRIVYTKDYDAGQLASDFVDEAGIILERISEDEVLLSLLPIGFQKFKPSGLSPELMRL